MTRKYLLAGSSCAAILAWLQHAVPASSAAADELVVTGR